MEVLMGLTRLDKRWCLHCLYKITCIAHLFCHGYSLISDVWRPHWLSVKAAYYDTYVCLLLGPKQRSRASRIKSEMAIRGGGQGQTGGLNNHRTSGDCCTLVYSLHSIWECKVVVFVRRLMISLGPTHISHLPFRSQILDPYRLLSCWNTAWLLTFVRCIKSVDRERRNTLHINSLWGTPSWN